MRRRNQPKVNKPENDVPAIVGQEVTANLKFLGDDDPLDIFKKPTLEIDSKPPHIRRAFVADLVKGAFYDYKKNN